MKIDWLRRLSSEVEKSHKNPEMEYKEQGHLAHPVRQRWIISERLNAAQLTREGVHLY